MIFTYILTNLGYKVLWHFSIGDNINSTNSQIFIKTFKVFKSTNLVFKFEFLTFSSIGCP